jgi:hypothetical protein
MKNIINYSNLQISKLLNVSELIASEIKQIIKNEIPVTNYKAVNNWVNQCYNKPSNKELKLCAVNEVLRGYGTESISHEAIYINSYYGNIVASYVNFGDTYINTVLLDHDSGKFTIMSWGDYYEKYLMKYDKNN